MVEISNLQNGEGYRGWSLWYLLWVVWLLAHYQLYGRVDWVGRKWVCVACVGYVNTWCVWLVCIVGLGEALVSYNWLVGKLMTPPSVCWKSLPNTTGKRIVTMRCTQNVSLLIAMYMFYLAQWEICHLPLRQKMVWVVVVVLRKANSIIVHPRGLWRSLYLSK